MSYSKTRRFAQKLTLFYKIMNSLTPSHLCDIMPLQVNQIIRSAYTLRSCSNYVREPLGGGELKILKSRGWNLLLPWEKLQIPGYCPKGVVTGRIDPCITCSISQLSFTWGTAKNLHSHALMQSDKTEDFKSNVTSDNRSIQKMIYDLISIFCVPLYDLKTTTTEHNFTYTYLLVDWIKSSINKPFPRYGSLRSRRSFGGGLRSYHPQGGKHARHLAGDNSSVLPQKSVCNAG